MKQKLVNLCDIKIGITPSRVDADLFNKHKFTSQLFDYMYDCQGKSKFPNETQPIFNLLLEKDEKLKDVISKKGDVLLDLNSLRAVVVDENIENYIVYQKYVILTCNNEIDSNFLCWYINEQLSQKKHSLLQSTTVGNVPVSMIRDISIDVPTLNQQKEIGHIYSLLHQKRKCEKRKLELETQLILFSLKNCYNKV